MTDAAQLFFFVDDPHRVPLLNRTNDSNQRTTNEKPELAFIHFSLSQVGLVVKRRGPRQS